MVGEMLLISGLSGAGKSTVLHALEDAGFFCTDNLPLEMLQDWILSMQGRKQQAAVCLDTRSGFTARAIKAAIEDMAVPSDWKLVFIEADNAMLQRRFSTVRRRHPFPNSDDLVAAIQLERESLSPLRDMADLILDSSHLTPYELAEQVDMFRLRVGKGHKPLINSMACTVMSFSYKNGLPAHADLVFDMRFLPNPHYQADLASCTGRDSGVIAFLQSFPEVAQAEQYVQQWLAFIWPQLKKERKHYFTLAFGCSGGRHRSVYMAERLAAWLQDSGMAEPAIQHRELGIVHYTRFEKDSTRADV